MYPAYADIRGRTQPRSYQWLSQAPPQRDCPGEVRTARGLETPRLEAGRPRDSVYPSRRFQGLSAGELEPLLLVPEGPRLPPEVNSVSINGAKTLHRNERWLAPAETMNVYDHTSVACRDSVRAAVSPSCRKSAKQVPDEPGLPAYSCSAGIRPGTQKCLSTRDGPENKYLAHANSHSSGQDQRNISMPKSANLPRLSARPG